MEDMISYIVTGGGSAGVAIFIGILYLKKLVKDFETQLLSLGNRLAALEKKDIVFEQKLLSIVQQIALDNAEFRGKLFAKLDKDYVKKADLTDTIELTIQRLRANGILNN